jgi:DEAD/DEAH box helicase domain-containing protein
MEERAASARNFLRPPTKRYVKLLAAMGESRSDRVRKLVDQDSFTWLTHLLKTGDESLYEHVALAQGLLFAREQTDPQAWLSAAQARLPDALGAYLEAHVDEETLLGLREGASGRDPVTLWASISPAAAQAITSDIDQARRGLTLAIYLDDRPQQQAGGFESAWNGALRLYNLFQFVPEAYPVTADEDAFQGFEELMGDSSPDSLRDHLPQRSASSRFYEEEWKQAFAEAEYSPDAVETLLERLYDAEIPAPDVAFELQKEGQIVGAAELGWQGANVAVLLSEQESYGDVFREEGWTVYTLPDVKADPESLIDILLEAA